MDASKTSYDSWIDNEVVDRAGEKVGKVTDVFYDDQTHRPEWLAVKTGLFGSNDTFIPIQGSSLDSEGRIQVAFDKAFIKDAPNVDTEDQHMTPEDERVMWKYYGYDYTDSQAVNAGYGKDYRTGQRADRDFRYNRFDRDSNDWSQVDQGHDEVIAEATAVSEQVQKVSQPETVRLRKYRRTEMVPVVKEEVRVEKDTDTQATTSRSTPPSDTVTASTRSTRRDS